MAGSDEFRLVSSGIDNEGRMPRKYTQEGQGALKNRSPPLEWYNVPQGTESLALVVQDLDAPDPADPLVPWTHWVVVNIPPSAKGLPEGFSGSDKSAGEGLKEGINDWKVPGWRGPKLPSHGHRFEFKLYALDEVVNLGNKVWVIMFMPAYKGFSFCILFLFIYGFRVWEFGRLRKTSCWRLFQGMCWERRF